MRKPIDLLGQVFGRLTVISAAGKNKWNNYQWQCKCDCGKTIIVPSGNLRRKNTTSCGHDRNITHGKTKSLEWNSYHNMKQRCYNPLATEYSHYGKRGITVCERWLKSFENFLEDMGTRPSKNHSLDRIDVNGNYEPSNCRWSTYIQQNNNTRTNIKIGNINLKAWCRENNKNYDVIRARISKYGWSIEEAITKPVRPRKKY